MSLDSRSDNAVLDIPVSSLNCFSINGFCKVYPISLVTLPKVDYILIKMSALLFIACLPISIFFKKYYTLYNPLES